MYTLDEQEGWMVVAALRGRGGDKPRDLADKIEKALLEREEVRQRDMGKR